MSVVSMCFRCLRHGFLFAYVILTIEASQNEFVLLPIILNQENGNSKGYTMIYGGENSTELRIYLNEQLGYPVVTALNVLNNWHVFENKYVHIFDWHHYPRRFILKMMREMADFRKLHSPINSHIYILNRHLLQMLERSVETAQYKTHVIVSDDPNPKVETVCPGHYLGERTSRDACENPLVGKTLNVSVFGSAPYVNRLITPLEGSDIDVINIIAQKIGFKIQLRLADFWNDAAIAVSFFPTWQNNTLSQKMH